MPPVQDDADLSTDAPASTSTSGAAEGDATTLQQLLTRERAAHVSSSATPEGTLTATLRQLLHLMAAANPLAHQCLR